jgi:2-polyprenyl-3-methyl-5-hydroxy-6-metoxy-1,4-benzoquinol methylase
MTTNEPTTEAQRDALASRILDATLGAYDLLAIQLGLELGLYRALANGGPATAHELAGRTGIGPRYAREWLEQQAVTGILSIDGGADSAESRRFALPAGHAEALIEPDSPAASAPMSMFVLAAGRSWDRLLEAYRSGSGVAWDAYPGLVEAQELANRPLFRNVLPYEWLPAIPDIHERLTDGGRVADLACGAGWSTIAMARAYPRSEVHGLDVDADSIARARGNAEAEGLADRIEFHQVDAGSHDLDGRFDLVTIFEAVHDLSRPVEVLRAARDMLAPGGGVLVVDEKVAETFGAPGDEIERLMYAYSIFFCLPNSLADAPSVATGTVMRPATLRRYAEEAGFSQVTILPIDHDTFRLYRLAP